MCASVYAGSGDMKKYANALLARNSSLSVATQKALRHRHQSA